MAAQLGHGLLDEELEVHLRSDAESRDGSNGLLIARLLDSQTQQQNENLGGRIRDRHAECIEEEEEGGMATLPEDTHSRDLLLIPFGDLVLRDRLVQLAPTELCSRIQ